MKLPLALFAGSLLFVSAADARPRRVFRMSAPTPYVLIPAAVASRPAPTPAAAPTPACDSLETLSLTAGAATWSLTPWNGRGCSAPYGVADTGSHRLQVLHVTSRMALAVTADAGVAELLSEGGRAVLTTTDGLCAPGVRTGAAIVEPGTYVLRATQAGEGAQTLRVEAMAVSPRAVMAGAGESWVSMSTGASEGDVRCDGDGADVRVLVCPNGRRAVLSAPNGMVASVEGPGSARTCFSVAQAQTVALPSGSLAIVRAWPYGAERGAAVIDLR